MFVYVFSENANLSKSVGSNVIIVRDLHNLSRKPTQNRHAKAIFPVSFVTFLSCFCQDNVISRQTHMLDQLLKGIFLPFPFFWSIVYERLQVIARRTWYDTLVILTGD